MPEGAFYQPKKGHPTALAVVLLLHGAAITALAMSKMDIRVIDAGPIDLIPISPPDPPPPPEPQTRVETPLPTTPPIYTPIPIIDPPIVRPAVTTTDDPPIVHPPIDRGPIIEVKPTPPPPPPQAKKVEPARARANLASYVSDADYPPAAVRAEEQGTTRFRLEVGADGRVKGCTVTGSSGSSVLDSATCRIMKSRARFTPARDSDGRAVSDSVANAIRWVLPDE